MHIFGEIPFVKPQNDTQRTVKRLKTMKNEKETYLFFFGGWSVVASSRKTVINNSLTPALPAATP